MAVAGASLRGLGHAFRVHGSRVVWASCFLCHLQELIAQQVPTLASLGPEGFKWTEVHEDAACGLCYTR